MDFEDEWNRIEEDNLNIETDDYMTFYNTIMNRTNFYTIKNIEFVCLKEIDLTYVDYLEDCIWKYRL